MAGRLMLFSISLRFPVPSSWSGTRRQFQGQSSRRQASRAVPRVRALPFRSVTSRSFSIRSRKSSSAMLSEVRIAILAGAAEESRRSSSRIFESTYAATSPMYSGSAPLILYSLPKIVTLSVSGCVAMRIPSDLCLGDGPGPGGPGRRTTYSLGVHRFFEYGKLDQHLLHPPRHRATLVEQRSALLLERVQLGLPVRRFLFSDRVFQGSHAILELAVLLPETIQELRGSLNLALQLVQLGDHRHVQGRPAAVDSTPPLRVARTADPSARTTFWTASSTSLSSSVRSGERNSSA